MSWLTPRASASPVQTDEERGDCTRATPTAQSAARGMAAKAMVAVGANLEAKEENIQAVERVRSVKAALSGVLVRK